MASVNKVILIGRLGGDPEIRHTSVDIAVANFSLATSKSYKDKNGEKIETTEWHNIVAWRSLAEAAEKFLKKGKQVYIEGSLETRHWEDNGVKRYNTKIVASNITFLDKVSVNENESEEDAPEPAKAQIDVSGKLSHTDNDDSDLPF